MSVWESLRIAFSSIRAHKMRSLLTMLGIIIGVGSVIIVVALGQSGEAMLKSQFVGTTNTIEVFYNPSEEEMSNPNFAFPSFTEDDVRLLQDIPEVKQVVTSSRETSNVRFREEEVSASVTGVNDAYVQVNDLNVEQGREFTSADFLGGARVAIIGSATEEELFGDDSALGEVIRIGVQPVEVIGVLEDAAGLFALGANEVYLPWNTWRTIYGSSDIGTITLQADNADDLQVAGEKAVEALNRVHGTEDSYMVFNMEAIAEGIGQITSIMTIIIGSIAGISLLVGGIGVMNIMLVSVTERTREIGIRMSIGATRGQIMFQFLVEAMTLTLIGGTIGIVFGVGIASIVSFFAGWPSLISWYVVVGAVLFSVVIGVVFGLLPANKASRLDPIEALRYE